MDKTLGSLLTEKDALFIFAKAWNTLDPTELINYLADNVRYESQNVLSSMNSAAEVSQYLLGKMNIIRNRPESRVYAELAETQPPDPPRFCVLLTQFQPDNLAAVVLINVSENKITSIDICSVVPNPRSVKRSGQYPAGKSVPS
jgi:hypothetical protein